jgi:purine-nucleoside phosphorylase
MKSTSTEAAGQPAGAATQARGDDTGAPAGVPQGAAESVLVAEAVAALRERTTLEPSVAVILGTGLGALADAIETEVSVPYAEIPHFPVSTVESHAGELVFGRLGGRPLVAMKGRVHYYEGYTMKQVGFPVRVMHALGARVLVVSNAVGGMHPLMRAGDLVLVVDHINLMGDNPLIGPNDDTLGPRYPDMIEPYDQALIELTARIARDEKIPLHQGVFVGVSGPNLETRAEYRMLRGLGADVVGMSLIPENLVAVHSSMRCLALSVVTDACLPDALEPVDIERILRTAAAAEPILTRLVRRVIDELPEAS